jgi:carboxylesterase type B
MKPPIGKLRFKEPQEPSKFQKTFDATGDASAYVAINPITFQCEGQEDAGILNVFTKDVKPKKLRPVMIWVSKNYKKIIFKIFKVSENNFKIS